jgi:predicted flavoprotein YhiN
MDLLPGRARRLAAREAKRAQPRAPLRKLLARDLPDRLAEALLAAPARHRRTRRHH